MKADVVSNRSTDSAESKKSNKLRFLDLSFDGKDVEFKGDELDNGRLPHGGYKGSKRHPLSLYTFDKGREFHKQLRDDLEVELEKEVVGVVGGSPSWALEAHRWPSNSGESPLLAHGFLPSSKLETLNGRLLTNPAGKPIRASAPTGVVYHRASRVHHFLSATDCNKDASDGEDPVRYGRPTRTTLLRARQKLNTSANGYELRRQLDQRMEEIRMSCAFSNPKDLLQLQSEVDGETFYSFLTGARYNRANCVDARNVTQHGVHVSRHNPQGCFAVPHRLDALDTNSAPPGTPEAINGPGSRTAPPSPPSPPTRVGGAPGPLTNGEEEHRLRVRGSRVFINSSREGPYKFEGRLPKLQQPRDTAADDTGETNQPPPTPVPPYIKLDNPSLPAVKQEAEPKTKAEDTPEKPSEDRKVDVIPEEKTEEEEEEKEKEEEAEKVEEQTEEEKAEEKVEEEKEKAIEEPTEKNADGEKEEEKAEEEEEKEEKTVEEDDEKKDEGEKEETEDTKEQITEVNTETPADDMAPDVIDTTSSPEDEQPPSPEVPAEEKTDQDNEIDAATRREKTGVSDDVKFFVTEGAGVDNLRGDVTTQNEAAPKEPDAAEAAILEDENEANATGEKEEEEEEEEEELPQDLDPTESSTEPRFQDEAVNETEAPETERDELEADQGQTTPLKVIVTHIERNMESPKEEEEEEGEEIIAKHP
ncbi:hypothetical protein ACOMHN_020170 [Nucella lapillus]